jgi:hypothetical protein
VSTTVYMMQSFMERKLLATKVSKNLRTLDEGVK